MLQSIATGPKALREAMVACRQHMRFAALFSAGVNILYFVPSLYMMQVYDRVIPTRGELTLVFVSAIALFSLGCLAALDGYRQRVLSRMAARLDRLLSLPVVLAQFGSRATGTAPTGVRQLDTFRAAITGPGALALMDAPWAPLFLITVFLIHPILGIFVGLGAAILMTITIVSQSRLRSDLTAADRAAAVAAVRTEASAALSGTSRALGMQQALAVKHAAERSEASVRAFAATSAAASVGSITKLLRMVLQSGVLGLGAYLAIKGWMSPGTVFAASLLAGRTLQPVEQLVGGWRTLLQGWTAFQQLRAVLADNERNEVRTPLPAPAARLEVENLVVMAPDQRTPLVKGASFRVKPGEIVALLGPSGAGKSTLAQALVGALPAHGGVVRLDGADIRHWSSEPLGEHLGYLPQEVGLFEGSIADNISRFRLWRGEARDALGPRVVTAAKEAGAHDMILRLPGGYDTLLGPGGRGVSGGQAQRIALARALFDAPPLLVLDEPNAFLDGEGEQALLATLEGVRQRQGAAIVIAQRIGVLSACDRIILMRDGRIEMDGPRDQVLAGLARAAQPQSQQKPAERPPAVGLDKPTEAA